MSAEGLIIMTSSIFVVSSLAAFCVYKLLKNK